VKEKYGSESAGDRKRERGERWEERESVRGRKTGYIKQETKSKMVDNQEKTRMVNTPSMRIETSSNCIY